MRGPGGEFPHRSEILAHLEHYARDGRAVRLLIAEPDVRVIDANGELLRELTLDPSCVYQPLGRGPRVQDVPTHVSGIF
jgi:hypothetical protein